MVRLKAERVRGAIDGTREQWGTARNGEEDVVAWVEPDRSASICDTRESSQLPPPMRAVRVA